MAAAVLTGPDSQLLPAHSNKLWFEVSGHVEPTPPAAGEYKFNYVIDLHVDGASDPTVRVLKKPDTGSTNAKFDIRGLLQTELSADTEGTATYPVLRFPSDDASDDDPFNLPSAGKDCIKVEIKVGRSYASSPDGTVSITAADDTHTVYLWNGTFQYTDEGTVVNKFALSGSTKRVLSDRKVNTFVPTLTSDYSNLDVDNDIFIKAYDDSYYVLSFLNDDGTFLTGHDATKIEVKLGLNDGTETASVYVDIDSANGAATPAATVDANQKLVRLGCGPAQVAEWDSSFGITLPANYAYYKIRWVDTNNAAASRFYVFLNLNRALAKNLFNGCYGDHDRYQFAWLNSRGGWDFANFNNITTVTTRASKKMYQRAQTEQGEPYESDFIRPAQTASKTSYTLRSEFLQHNEMEFLRQAINSPQTYLIALDGGDAIIPVNVKTSTFSNPANAIGKSRFFTLEVEEAAHQLVQFV